MIGMTKNRQHFYRAMLMLRLPNDMPESDIPGISLQMLCRRTSMATSTN
jgi:hypothetical protein